jgi:hypothetical protein
MIYINVSFLGLKLPIRKKRKCGCKQPLLELAKE